MIQINENITLRYIPMTKLKSTLVGAYIYRPVKEEEISANALLPYVLQRGCREYPTLEEFSRHLEGLYGSIITCNVNKQGDAQILGFNAKSISDRYAPEGEKLTSIMTKLLMSVLFDPVVENGAFMPEVVRQEKKSAKDGILALINDKQAYTQRRCIEEMCGDDGYALSKNGTIEGMDALDEKNLYEHYKNIITSSRIDIFVCGETDIDAVADAIHCITDSISFTPAQLPIQTMFTPVRNEIQEVSESMDVTQGKLSIGFTTEINCKDERYWALMVANSIFGGGVHSKLFNNVREKLSLAYYASSNMEKSKGIMMVNAGIEFDNYKKALDEIYTQLDEMKAGNITDDEFSAAILSLINSLDSYYDDLFYMQIFSMSQIISGTNCDIEFMKEKIKALTKADIVAVAQNIRPDTVFFLKGVQA